MKAYRASLLYFAAPGGGAGRAIFEEDGLLVTASNGSGVQRVQAIGDYRSVAARYPDVPVEHWSGRIIAPGFVDMHIHFPQVDVIGSPAEGLLPWLEHYTFPHESRFSDAAYNAPVAAFFIDELLRQGCHHGPGICQLAPGCCRFPAGRGAKPRPAHDCRQGPDGSELAGWRA